MVPLLALLHFFTHCVSLPPPDEDWGIVGRLAQDVFQLLGQKRPAGSGGEPVDHTVRVSYMELYGEELRDLLELHTNHKELHIREDDRGNTGQEEHTVSVYRRSHAGGEEAG